MPTLATPQMPTTITARYSGPADEVLHPGPNIITWKIDKDLLARARVCLEPFDKIAFRPQSIPIRAHASSGSMGSLLTDCFSKRIQSPQIQVLLRHFAILFQTVSLQHRGKCSDLNCHDLQKIKYKGSCLDHRSKYEVNLNLKQFLIIATG